MSLTLSGCNLAGLVFRGRVSVFCGVPAVAPGVGCVNGAVLDFVINLSDIEWRDIVGW